MTASRATPRVVRDAGSAISSRVVSTVAQAVILVILARLAGPHLFGQYAQLSTLGVFLAAASSCGIQTLVVREFSRPKDRDECWPMFSLQLMLSLLTAIVASAVAFGMGFRTGLVWLVPLLTWLEAQVMTQLGLLMASGRAPAQIAALLALRLPVLLALLPCMSGARERLAMPTAILVGIATSAVIVLVLTHVLGGRLLSRTGIAESQSILRRALPFLLASLAWQLRQLDVALVGALSGAVSAGQYAVSARLVSPLRLLETSLSSIAVPYARRGEREHLTMVNRSMLAVLSLAVSALVVGNFFLRQIVSALLGTEYLPAVTVMRVTLLATLLLIGAGYMTTIISASGGEVFVAKQGAILALLFLLAVSLTSRLIGPVGAAASVAVINGVQLVSSFRRFRRMWGAA